MVEPVTFPPGDQASSGTWSDDTIPIVDDRLIDLEGNYIVDNSGNRILLGGGFDNGDDSVQSTWLPGDML